MLDHFIENRDTVRRLRSGVIGSQFDSFTTHLAQYGYAATTVRAQLTMLGHFSQWLTRRGCGIHELNDELVGTFVNDRKRRGRLHRGHAATLHQFLTHLRARGVVASPAPMVDESLLGQLQRHYEQYLRVGRAGLRTSHGDEVLRGVVKGKYLCRAPPPVGPVEDVTAVANGARRARRYIVPLSTSSS